MKLYLDSANLKDINECAKSGVISGLTVNQSLLAKEPKCDPITHLRAIGEVLHETSRYWPEDTFSVSFPLIGASPDEMIAFSNLIGDSQKVWRKIPISWDNLPVFATLRDPLCINATCVFSVYQADMAIRAGAIIVSPFVGRMNDVQADYGYRVLTAIKKRHPDITVLAGSVRNEEMVAKVEECGADIATVSRAVLESMANDPHSAATTARFNADFAAWQAQ
jgi:transaldolase